MSLKLVNRTVSVRLTTRLRVTSNLFTDLHLPDPYSLGVRDFCEVPFWDLSGACRMPRKVCLGPSQTNTRPCWKSPGPVLSLCAPVYATLKAVGSHCEPASDAFYTCLLLYGAFLEPCGCLQHDDLLSTTTYCQ